MISAKIVSNWINKPNSLIDTEKTEMGSYAVEYPYFLPLQYLNWFHQQNSKITLFNLNEIHPTNQVLLHSFFHPTIVEEEVIENEAFFTSPVDYFTHQGVVVDHELPLADVLPKKSLFNETPEIDEKEKSLMVVMSYTEWLNYLQTKTKKEIEEKEGQKALKAMWQKQKIAEALEEENEEIPDSVFEMAVNSILPEEEFFSESLADVYAMQGKKEKAIDIFKKLSLQSPEKNGYFAQKIRNLQK